MPYKTSCACSADGKQLSASAIYMFSFSLFLGQCNIKCCEAQASARIVKTHVHNALPSVTTNQQENREGLTVMCSDHYTARTLAAHDTKGRNAMSQN